ncbi:MAG: hypothetical protein EXS55_01950 [Candidatus Magasanikbacteria bacterium]|nr:hypothetical protein [Candidatus Magasanikbacteria bacterium]
MTQTPLPTEEASQIAEGAPPSTHPIEPQWTEGLTYRERYGLPPKRMPPFLRRQQAADKVSRGTTTGIVKRRGNRTPAATLAKR